MNIKNKTAVSFCAWLLSASLLLSSQSFAASIGSEPPDLSNVINSNVFVVTAAGTSTITGTLGPTGTGGDGQDQFNVIIPAALKVESVSLNLNIANPSFNLVGCGLTGVGNLNQAFTTLNSDCTLSYLLATNNSVGSAPWAVSINASLSGSGASNQSISGFSANPVVAIPLGSSTLSATASSGLAVVFGSSTPAVCTVSGTIVSYLAQGTCTVTANQAGIAGVFNAAAQEILDITVSKADQTITFAQLNNRLFTPSGTFSAPATSDSGLTVTVASTTPGVCTVSGNTVTQVNAGTCNLTASQAGNANYNSATPVNQSVIIGKANQFITFADPADQTFTPTGTFSAPATSTSALAVTVTSTTIGVCTIAGFTVTMVTAGTCNLTASQAGNGNYNAAASVNQSVIIGQANQTITFADPVDQIFSPSGAFNAPASSDSGLAVTVTSTTPGVCTISGNTVTQVTVGTCNLTASQAGDSNYNAATPVIQSVLINKANQTVSDFMSTPAIGEFGSTSTLTATSDAYNTVIGTDLIVVFGTATPAICAVSGSTVNFITTGICTVTADQSGDANYNPLTQLTLDITVNAILPGAPAITNIQPFLNTLTVSFDPPASDGGSPIINYELNCSGFVASGLSSPIMLTLPDDFEYECSITAENNVGVGLSSPVVIFAIAPVIIPVLSTFTYALLMLFIIIIATLILKGNLQLRK
jgi:hypothetical protein